MEYIDKLAKRIWDYHLLEHKIEKVDIIFVLCSNDLRVVDYAVELFFSGHAPVMIISGGIAHQGDLLSTGWKKSEAEIFSDRAIDLGVPEEKILIENKAQNTGENVVFTEKILGENNIKSDSMIIVQKPYMERRSYATIQMYWLDKTIIVTSPPISSEEYPNNIISKEDLINIMLGDLQRIREYPKRGFQISQEIPREIEFAYEELKQLGYTKHLLF